MFPFRLPLVFLLLLFLSFFPDPLLETLSADELELDPEELSGELDDERTLRCEISSPMLCFAGNAGVELGAAAPARELCERWGMVDTSGESAQGSGPERSCSRVGSMRLNDIIRTQ